MTDQDSIFADSSGEVDHIQSAGGEGLLLTRFRSLEDFKSVVRIKYLEENHNSSRTLFSHPEVCLTYHCGDKGVTSVLKIGVSEDDFVRAMKGSAWDRLWLGMRCPYAVLHKKELQSVENLGRRKSIFGKGDVAFYDLAENMVNHISDEDLMFMPAEDLSEKGYLNTFNHITAQALMTSMFSETLADFVADVHERHNLPEMITGTFTKEQLADLEDGPVDNYLDMINNEWGQELGKDLSKKYHINSKIFWSPGLLADYLNDIQSYNSWAFQIAFKPFRPQDEVIIRFAKKINHVVNNYPL